MHQCLNVERTSPHKLRGGYEATAPPLDASMIELAGRAIGSGTCCPSLSLSLSLSLSPLFVHATALSRIRDAAMVRIQ